MFDNINNQCFFTLLVLFFVSSLVKAIGLEYKITSKKWSFLQCRELFEPHTESSPIKSIIPIAVGSKLIVLSMSREFKTDGTYGTQQNFYEFIPLTKTFTLVASVQDIHRSLPITQWTVLGDVLITVKASTLYQKHLSQVEYIHQFSAIDCTVKTHKIECVMQSSLRVLMKVGTISFLVLYNFRLVFLI